MDHDVCIQVTYSGNVFESVTRGLHIHRYLPVNRAQNRPEEGHRSPGTPLRQEATGRVYARPTSFTRSRATKIERRGEDMGWKKKRIEGDEK